MSVVIDQKVVEMQFDGRQFAQGVQSTIALIAKLKSSLNFNGATKGLSELDSASKKVNFEAMGSGIDALKLKFSALEVMGVTALANLTNSAVNAGKKIASSLTIAPIKTGFQEYETQIGAIQTILANTESKGTTLQDVNSALDTLNAYADKTIYNFSQMTKNIGTFTAAGVDLETSVGAIQGIANLAAVSGSTSQQASTAMYQLSQALAAGRVSLMDWNSVVNAGMGGQVFQDALKRTSEVMGTGAEAAIKKYGSFRESLTKGEWLTTDVLTKTLEQFTMAAEKGTEEWEVYKKSLMDDGYTAKQAEEILKMANTATDAATKVKTFTQLWDTLKESAQSGWAQTWEILVGDFGEAKNFLTEISNRVGGILGSSAKARNDLLTGGLSSGWKQLLYAGIADEAGYIDTFKNVAKEHKVSIDDMIASEKKLDATLTDDEAFHKVLKKGLTDGTISSDMLSESVSKMADKMSKMSAEERAAAGYTSDHVKQIKELDKGLKDGSISMDDFVNKMTRASGRENIIQSLWNVFDGIMSVIEPIKQAFSEIFPKIKPEQIYALTEGLKEFTNSLKLSSEYSEKLKTIFKGVFSIASILGKALGVVGKVLWDVLSSEGFKSIVDLILDITATIANFFTSLNERIETKGIKNALSGIVDLFSEVLVGIAGGADGLRGLFSMIGGIVKNGMTTIWDGIKTVLTWIDDNLSPSDILAGLAGSSMFMVAKNLGGLAKSFGNLIDNLFGEEQNKNPGIRERFKGISDAICDTLRAVHDTLVAFTTGIRITSILGIAVALTLLAGALDDLSKLKSANMGKALLAMTAMVAILSGSFRSIVKVLQTMTTRGLFGATTVLLALASGVNTLADAIVKLADIKIEKLAKSLMGLAASMKILTGGLKAIAGSNVTLSTSVAVLALANSCGTLADAMKKFGDLSLKEIGKGMIGMAGGLAILVKALGSLGNISGTKIASTTSNVFGKKGLFGGAKMKDNFKSFSANINGLTNIFSAAGLWIAIQGLKDLADAMKDFGEMSWSEIGHGLAGMGAALAEVGTVTGLLGKFVGFSSILGGTSLLIAAQSLGDMANALKKFGEMSWDEIKHGLAGMGGALTEVGVVTGALGKLAGFSGLLGGGALVIAVQSLADLADAFKKFGGMSWSEIGRGLAGMGGALVELGAVTGALGKLAGLSGIVGGFALDVAVESLGELADALKKFGEMSWGEIKRGLVGMGGALLELGIVLGIMSKMSTLSMGSSSGKTVLTKRKTIGSFKNFMTEFSGLGTVVSAGALVLAVQSLEQLADGLQKFGEMSWGEIGRGLAAMGGALLEIGTITTAMGYFGGLASLIGSGSVLLTVQGLDEMANALKKFGEMSWDEIGRGLTAMGAALGELAMGSIINSLGILGSISIANVAEPLGVLADSVKKWTNMTIPENLSEQLGLLGGAVRKFTFSGLGAGALDKSAPAIGVLADSVKKWTGISVPENLPEHMGVLADGVSKFFLKNISAGALSTAAPAVGVMADSVKKWSGVSIPEGLTDGLSNLADAVSAFTWSFAGGWSMNAVVGPLGDLAGELKKWNGISIPVDLTDGLRNLGNAIDSFLLGAISGAGIDVVVGPLGKLADDVKKWNGITITEGLCNGLKDLADGVKSFSWAFMGGFSIDAVVGPLGKLADDVKKWNGITITEGLCSGLKDLSDGVKSFSWAFMGGLSMDTIVGPIGDLAGAISKWNGVTVPEGLSDNLETLADAVKSFSWSFVTAGNLDTIPDQIGSLATAVKKWNGVIVPAKLGDQLDSVATGVKAFNGVGDVSSATSALKSLAGSIGKLAGVNFGVIATGLTKVSTSFSSFAANSASLSGVGTTIVNNIIKPLQSAASKVSTVGPAIVSALAKGISSSSSQLVVVSNGIVSTITKSITSKMVMLTTVGLNLMKRFSSGITSSTSSVKNAISNMLSSAVSAMRSYWSSFYSAGSYVVSGFASGISVNTFRAEAKARAMAKAAIEAAKDELDINSPSKVFRAIGKGVPEGFAQGISMLGGRVANSTTSMANNAIDSAKNAISAISSALSADIDVRPTIAPVIDLSDVQTGVKAINGMFGNGYSFGVSSNVARISSMMNSRSQNGSNADVVYAIDKLRKSMSDLGNTTYNVNGVTYDDGSNVSNAVKDIIRYTRIEGRV